MAEAPELSQREQIEKQRRRARREDVFRKELAMRVYNKHGLRPLPEEQLEYRGRMKGFSVIGDELTFCGKNLSVGARALWLVLFASCRADDPRFRVSWFRRDSLAALLGKSDRAVGGWLRELEDKGLLKSKRRLGHASLRLLFDPPKKWARETRRRAKKLGEKTKSESSSR